MKKRIKKHIDNKNYVKVYLADDDGFNLTNFEGIIFDQNDKFIFMSDFKDFNFDGFVVAKKSDITEIKRTEKETFIDTIFQKEGIKDAIIEKASLLNFKLGNFHEMFENLKKLGQAIIIERLYKGETVFQIGPVSKVEPKKVFIDYINAKGEYDLKPVTSKFKDITFIQFDNPYANMYFIYTRSID